MKKIAILGSTGSIGTQTLDVISKKKIWKWSGFLLEAILRCLKHRFVGFILF